jgi:hypothetical protein
VTGTTKKTTWKSSNKKIASVSSGGKVTAKKNGNATITANVSGKKYSCKVMVQKSIPLKSINLNQHAISLNVGDTAKLKVICNPANTTDSTEVEWESSDENIAEVEGGKIVGVSEGQAEITATVGKFAVTCIVTVSDNQKTDTVIDSTANNILQLKKYIKKNGSVNSSGNYFINEDMTYDGLYINAGIVYETDTDAIEFLCVAKSSTVSETIVMDLPYPDNTATTTVSLIVSTGASAKSQVKFDAATYTKNSTLSFEVLSSYFVSDSSIQDNANSCMQMAFSNWQWLLYKANTSFDKIGFTSY